MLIPTAFIKLPDESGCYNGEVVMGGTVSQLAMGLAQLSHCKFLGEAHYYVGREVIAARGGRTRIVEPSVFKATTAYNFLYQSTPLSSHLGLIIQYVSANFFAGFDVSVEIELRDTASNSYTGAVLDVGCEFTEVDLESDPNNMLTAFTGADLIPAPTNINPEPPRPLYVPSANRGELLNVRITTNNMVLLGVHIYDLFDPEVTP